MAGDRVDIVIVSEFCEDFSRADNDRFLYLANLLACEYNADVELVTSSFRHTTKRHRRETAAEWPFRITIVEEPGYPTNVCLRRFWSHWVWGRNVARHLEASEAPNVVYCAVPSLSGAWAAARYARRHGVRFVVDVQDLWPEAFRMVLDVPILSDLAFLPLRLLADSVYGMADAVCAVSETYAKRALCANGKCVTATVTYLGTDLAKFDEAAGAGDPILRKSDGELWLAYCGTLGSSYDLATVIDAMVLVGNEVPGLRLVVMGDGPRRDEFERHAAMTGVDALFVGRLRYDQMVRLLAECDVAVNPISHGAAQSIINKHADYVAAGLPIVSTQESEEFRSLVDEYGMGFNCASGDVGEVAAALRELAADSGLRLRMGAAARRCAKERFDRRTTYPALVGALLGEEPFRDGD